MNRNYITIQWHLTEKCNNHCKHCYMSNITKELTKEEILKIFKNIDEFEKKWDFYVTTYILTGGDPLLYKDIELVFQEIRKRGREISLLGNPDTVNEKTIELMKKYDVLSFQLSLDGLKERHDDIRREGSYDLTLKSAKLLQESGIGVNIMFTVNNDNYMDLIPLMKVIHENRIGSFSFDFLCAAGHGSNIEMIGKEEGIKLLNDYLDEKERYLKLGTETFFHEKNALLRKLRKDRGKFFLGSLDEDIRFLGCYIGFTSFAITADGYFMPCRRLNEKYENLLETPLEDIFLGNEELKKYRRREFFKQCGKCKMFDYCRGCPAVTKGSTGDPFGKFYLCDEELSDQKPVEEKLKTSKEEERELISKHYRNIFNNKFDLKMRSNRAFYDLVMMFLFQPQEQLKFMSDPDTYLKKINCLISHEDIVMLCYSMELLHMGFYIDLGKHLFGGSY